MPKSNHKWKSNCESWCEYSTLNGQHSPWLPPCGSSTVSNVLLTQTNMMKAQKIHTERRKNFFLTFVVHKPSRLYFVTTVSDKLLCLDTTLGQLGGFQVPTCWKWTIASWPSLHLLKIHSCLSQHSVTLWPDKSSIKPFSLSSEGGC